jgi:ABC-type uncharacterized transport system fused permease/ATPase subunit
MQQTLALEWRAWMTKKLLDDYLASRTFYTLQVHRVGMKP